MTDGVEDRGGTEREPGGGAEQATSPATPLTQQVGRVVVVLLVVLFVVFAAANAQRVDFSWVIGGSEVREAPDGEPRGGVPLIVLLVASFVVGAVAGALGVWQVRRSHRRSAEPR